MSAPSPRRAAPLLPARPLFFSAGPRGAVACRKKKLDFSLATLLCYLLYGTPVTDKYNRHSSPRIVPRRSAVRARAFAFFSTLPRLPPFFVSPPRPSPPSLPPARRRRRCRYHHQPPSRNYSPTMTATTTPTSTPATSTHRARRPTLVPTPTPTPTTDDRRHRAPATNAGHTGARRARTRALVFIIRVFWNFSSGARHCFTVCHCYTPTSCQARALQPSSMPSRTPPPRPPSLLPSPPVLRGGRQPHVHAQGASKVVRFLLNVVYMFRSRGK